jgi:fructosamine-3-kinase
MAGGDRSRGQSARPDDGDIWHAVGEALGSKVRERRTLSGGDINRAYAVTLDDGRRWFVKTNPRPPAGMFPSEARGLAWLSAARALRVPAVAAVDEGFLVLELLQPGPRTPSFDEDLGRGLAALHRAGAPAFGLDHDNYIGRLPQSNRPAASWSELYRRERLEPQVRRAAAAALITPSLARAFERLYGRLAELVGPDEPPSRLHGDLWGGNLMGDDRGAPCLIDPAVYGGHREVDLAMMRLFGGFGPRVFAAYAEAYPLAPGHEDRVPLYQLYPLLVHVNLFGGSYLDAVASAVSRLS